MNPERNRTPRRVLALIGSATILATVAISPAAAAPPDTMRLQHVGSFFVQENEVAGDTSAEILDLTSDGSLMVYTDAPGGVIGFVDSSDPSDPQPLGTIPAAGVTSAAIVKDAWLLVAVSTGDFVGP